LSVSDLDLVSVAEGLRAERAASEPSSLGTIARIVSTQVDSAFVTSERFRLQSVARALLPGERVAKCFRCLRPMVNGVDVLHNPVLMSGRFLGLQRCASVWLCPVCAPKITEERRKELARAIEVAPSLGLRVYLETRTVRHQGWQDLGVLLPSFNGARRSAMAGRAGLPVLREAFGYVGAISALEVTWGKRSGWHPHTHSLVFLPGEVDASKYASVARHAWHTGCRRVGLECNEHGYRLDATYGAVADYVAKYGHEPERPPWGPDAELTKAHVKRARNPERMSPFALLAAADESGEAASLFKRYAREFKGKHQLQWTQGLRELLGIEARTDDEIVEDAGADGFELLGRISREEWRAIVSNDARSEVVRAAAAGSWGAIQEIIAACIA
jgi:hypothetical protein